jgi:hypothetical protein
MVALLGHLSEQNERRVALRFLAIARDCVLEMHTQLASDKQQAEILAALDRRP